MLLVVHLLDHRDRSSTTSTVQYSEECNAVSFKPSNGANPKFVATDYWGRCWRQWFLSLFWQFQVQPSEFQVQPLKFGLWTLYFFWRLTAIVLAECLQGTGSAKSGVRNCSKCKVAGTTIRRRQSPLRRVNGRTGKMHRGWFAQLRCSSDVVLQTSQKIVGSSKCSF